MTTLRHHPSAVALIAVAAMLVLLSGGTTSTHCRRWPDTPPASMVKDAQDLDNLRDSLIPLAI